MIKTEPFGRANEHSVDKITLSNEHITLSLINYGVRTVELKVADRDGKSKNIALNYPDMEGYLKDTSFLGATCGRAANRTANHRFTNLSGCHELDANDGEHHLHGGSEGFDKRLWQYEIDHDALSVTFTLHSPDGDMGYPGNCDVRATIQLDHNQIITTFDATCDQASIINLTDHSYYNLTGDFSQTILEHELWIAADHITPTDGTLIPTGILQPVTDTPFDFTAPRSVDHPSQFTAPNLGYDVNYCLRGPRHQEQMVCQLYDPASGRQLTLYTTEPGLQLYTGGYLSNDKIYGKFTGIALEPQTYPNSANTDHFPSPAISPDTPYHHTIRMVFTTRND